MIQLDLGLLGGGVLTDNLQKSDKPAVQFPCTIRPQSFHSEAKPSLLTNGAQSDVPELL